MFVIDIPRCQNPNTFSSNMLYSLSIMYKMKLPMIIVFNKSDLCKENKCDEWITDFDSLQVRINNKINNK